MKTLAASVGSGRYTFSMDDAKTSRAPLGLIAGQGALPYLTARGAWAQGRRVICGNLGGLAWPETRNWCVAFEDVGVARLGEWVSLMQRHNVQQVIIAGRVPRRWLYEGSLLTRAVRFRPDLPAIRMFMRKARTDQRDSTIFDAMIQSLQNRKLNVIESTAFVEEHLAVEGLMAGRELSKAQRADLDFAWPLLKTLTQHDVGQSIAIAEKHVIAVEAVEGTDAMIRRAGELRKGKPWMLIKMANGRVDRRVDVPSIGLRTVEAMRDAKCSCVVVQAGEVLLLEKPKLLELAGRYGLTVFGRM